MALKRWSQHHVNPLNNWFCREFNGMFLRLRRFNEHSLGWVHTATEITSDKWQKHQLARVRRINCVDVTSFDSVPSLNWWICWLSYLYFWYTVVFSLQFLLLRMNLFRDFGNFVTIGPMMLRVQFTVLSVEFWSLIHWPCILIRFFFPLFITSRIYL